MRSQATRWSERPCRCLGTQVGFSLRTFMAWGNFRCWQGTATLNLHGKKQSFKILKRWPNDAECAEMWQSHWTRQSFGSFSISDQWNGFGSERTANSHAVLQTRLCDNKISAAPFSRHGTCKDYTNMTWPWWSQITAKRSQHCIQKQGESCPPRGHAFKGSTDTEPHSCTLAKTSGFMHGWNIKCRCPKVHPCLVFILCSGRFQELGHIAAKSEPCSYSSVEVACKVSFSPFASH